MSSVAADTIADLLSRGLRVRFSVSGDSMAPLLVSGDALLIGPVAASEVRRGDVVLSRTDRGLTAHRVIAISRTAPLELITRGDNAPADDAPFSERELLGRVLAVERGGRTRAVRRLSGSWLAATRLVARVRGFVARRLLR